MAKSKIEWTEETWNPVTGCNKISPGCKNCYADRMAKRLQSMGVQRYKNGFNLTIHYDDILFYPITKWNKPRIVFVNSMSDLFHKDVPLYFIKDVFSVMNLTPQHTYQILTKRPERVLELQSELNWTENIWLGVSVENADYISRIRTLSKIKTKNRFLSIEPLLGFIGDIPLKKIGWVIVGGESGPGYREMKKEWVTSLRDQCLKKGVPFFFKQWGTNNKKKAGRLLDGKIWNQFPNFK